MSVSKKELIKVVEELNEKIVDPAIKMKDEKKMKKQILKAAKFIEKGDDISKETMTIIKKLKGKKAKKSTDEVEPTSKKKSKKGKKEKSSKKEKTGKKKKKTKGSIKDFAIEGFASGKFGKKTNEQVAEIIREKFGSTTNAGGVSWYRGEGEK